MQMVGKVVRKMVGMVGLRGTSVDRKHSGVDRTKQNKWGNDGGNRH